MLTHGELLQRFMLNKETAVPGLDFSIDESTGNISYVKARNVPKAAQLIVTAIYGEATASLLDFWAEQIQKRLDATPPHRYCAICVRSNPETL